MGSLGLGQQGGAGQQQAVDRFRASPGYQNGLSQSLQQTQRAGAAQGLGGSGAEQMEAQKRAQGMADKEYGNYQNQLGGLARGGMQGAEYAGQLATGLAGQGAGLYENLGQGFAESQMAQNLIKAKKSASRWGALGSLGGGIISTVPFW